MDSTIIAAIIAGLFGVATAAATALAGWANNRRRLAETRRSQAEKETLDVSQAAQSALRETSLYNANSVVSTMVMTDFDGRTEVTKRYSSIKVNPRAGTINSIPGRSWVIHPAGEIIRGPELDGAPTLPTKYVELKIVSADKKVAEFNIEVTGGLTANDPAFDFGVKTVYSKGMCIDSEEMALAYNDDLFKFEYHSFDVTFPIGLLDLEVIFPGKYLVQVFPMVFNLNSEDQNGKELERVRGGFNKTAKGATFRIDEPTVLFRYAIYWIPPTRNVVDALRR